VAKESLRDMVIILPGCMGSVLQKDDKDIWAISGQAAWQVLKSLGNSISDLKLAGDDPDLDDLGDGIKATRIVQDFHIVPGLVKVDGYTGLRRLFQTEFDQVVQGTIDSSQPANYYEFPYDWRRDIRPSARKLRNLIERQLPIWRDYSNAKDAKVVLLAHSMGGLVSRYYVEVLDGWRDCRALITFGTPFRGSLSALGALAHGYKQLFLDLTELARSFTSIHQFLPIYPVLRVGGEYQRIAETDNVPGVDPVRAQAALKLHREIEAAVNQNLKDPDYRTGFKTLPVVGTRQPTDQSAVLVGGQVTITRSAPPILPADLADGDGTVPRVSAIPIELSTEYRETFVVEQHGALQNHPAVLQHLRDRIVQMGHPGIGAIRDVGIESEAEGQPALSLDVDDLYVPGEPVHVRAEIINQKTHPGRLIGRLESLTGDSDKVIDLDEKDGQWTATLGDLGPGVYRITLETWKRGPSAVHGLFEVAG
jgi:pimeloyl-ACP methyl ester carboxylesterase